MAKTIKDFREELDDLRQCYGKTILVPCSDKENECYQQMQRDGKPLPNGLFQDGDIFFKVDTSCFTEQELQEYLSYKKLKCLETIKNCIVFFTVLNVLGIVGAVLLVLIETLG